MKKLFFLVALAFMTVTANAQAVIAEIDWTQRSEYLDLWYSTDYATVTVEQGTGLIIDNSSDGTTNYWEPQVPIIGHIPVIDEGEDYQVKFQFNSPVAGELRLDFCSWDGSSATHVKVFEVAAGDNDLTIDFEDYPTPCIDAMIFYQCGKLPGRHIIKNVKIVGPEPTPYDPTDICYNFTAEAKVAEVISNTQNPYSGIVEIPSKVTHEGEEYSVTKIGDNAFEGCSLLGSVTIPNSVTSIGEQAFYGCSGLTSVEIPNSVTSIGEDAFRGCSGLTSVEIPSSVTTIGEWAFQGCSGLTSVEIPSSVTSIGEEAFRGCSGLTSVKVESGNMTYDSRDNCNAIIETSSNTLIMGFKNTIIPNSVTSIGYCAFDCCSGLTSIEIPNSVTTIGGCAFLFCSGLTSIKIPNSVTYIGSWAFADCAELTDVYCYAENVPSTNTDAFNDSYPEYITLHVPAGSISAYSETAPWNSFKAIVAIEETGETYTLTYKVDGEEYKTYSLKEGEAIAAEDEPTKDGYEFSGWSEIPQYMPANNLTIVGSFDLIADYDEIKIGSTGKATFSSKYDLDFSAVEGLKAYTATGYENEDATVWLSRVLRVPAGTGLMVKGDAGTYKVPHTTSASYYTNLFKANTGGQISIGETDGEWTNYYLSGGQFKKVNGSANIGHKKCYLQLPSRFFSKTRSIEVVYDDEEVTGINGQWIMDKDSDAWYNINGLRISQPTKKGLYIHNGKKVVIK